jgi:uncharacterized protein (TIGR02646 family)
MRTILKGREPASLVEYRAAGGTTYENYQDKDTLRTHLIAEQRGLCCYCLSRIRADPGKMKIEHWHSQEHYRTQQLDYSNLLAACMGHEGSPGRDQHCDTRKANQDLSRNPANPMHRVEDLIQFRGDGQIVSSDPAFDAELNSVLNLNVAFLKNNRKETLNAFQYVLAKFGELPRTQLEKWLRDWNGESSDRELREFCQVVVYWLRKRLRRP